MHFDFQKFGKEAKLLPCYVPWEFVLKVAQPVSQLEISLL